MENAYVYVDDQMTGMGKADFEEVYWMQVITFGFVLLMFFLIVVKFCDINVK